MLRCALAALALAVSLPAAAQSVQRKFPQDALRGEITFYQPPDIKVNGEPARLAPGARIRGTNNMLAMSGALVGATATVNYTVEPGGLVLNVWILTPQEQAVQPWPKTLREARTWAFDPVAQTWTSR